MTTAGRFHDTAAIASTVSIAGVPWPAYKVIALLVGVLVFAVVAVPATTMGPAVLSGAGVAAALWVGIGLSRSARR